MWLNMASSCDDWITTTSFWIVLFDDLVDFQLCGLIKLSSSKTVVKVDTNSENCKQYNKSRSDTRMAGERLNIKYFKGQKYRGAW